jgi:hypothetical protein
MRRPDLGCSAPAAIVTARAQFVHVREVDAETCSLNPINYSASLGYQVSANGAPFR